LFRKLVLDTNIYISAFFWNGNERRVLIECKKGSYQLITSPSILDEVERVLLEKFEVPTDKINAYIEEILIFSEIVFPIRKIDIIRQDPSDNMVLEAADTGNADVIVSGDNHLRKLKRYRNIRIIGANALTGDNKDR